MSVCDQVMFLQSVILLCWYSLCRHPIHLKAGVSPPHHLLAWPVPILHGSQLPRQAALGGCPGVSRSRQQGLQGQGGGWRGEWTCLCAYLESRLQSLVGVDIWSVVTFEVCAGVLLLVYRWNPHSNMRDQDFLGVCRENRVYSHSIVSLSLPFPPLSLSFCLHVVPLLSVCCQWFLCLNAYFTHILHFMWGCCWPHCR